jgi:cell division septation protein DedD
MALGKLKDTWFILVLIVIAAIFAVMAFSKEKPKVQPSAVQDVLADKAQPVASSQPAAVVATAPSQPTGLTAEHLDADVKKVPNKKPVSTVVMPPTEMAPRETLAVQVYSFKEKVRAEAALSALKDKKYSAYILVSDLGPRGIWYRVRVGTFTNEADARKALESITRDFKSGIIVTE